MTDNDRTKKITLFSTDGKRWDAEFEGNVNRRDIAKLSRTLAVEYAKVQRKRSVARIVGEPVKETPTEEQTNGENENREERSTHVQRSK